MNLIGLMFFFSAAHAALPPESVVPDEVRREVRQNFDSQTRQSNTKVAGHWTGSGGDGIACFDSDANAQRALDEKGRLVEAMRAHILQVSLLDLQEWSKTYQYSKPNPDEQPVDFVKRKLKDHLCADMPYLLQKLEDNLDLVGSQDWQKSWSDQGPLALVPDAGPENITLPPHCRVVQLAIRYAHSQPGSKPQVFVDVDQRLIAMIAQASNPVLATLHVGGLLLHEAIWLAGVELEMPDAAPARRLTAALLSENLFEAIDSMPAEKRKGAWTSVLYSIGFRQFYSLFEPLGSPMNLSIQENSKASRRMARASIASKYAKIAQEMGIDLDSSEPMDKVAENRFLLQLFTHLTDEELFLFTAESLANMGKIPFNNDVFYLDGIDNTPHFHYACGLVRLYLRFDQEGGDSSEPWMTTATERSLQYCSQLGFSK